MEHIQKSSENLQKLNDTIKHAIEDGKLSFSEFDRIMAIAEADGIIDPQEQKLLKQLNDMIASGAIERIPG